ncbi:MAG: aminopeptidase, partial [Quisquiliibacterium sp.]
MARLALLLLLSALAACSANSPDLGYYLQSVSGHFGLMAKARSIDQLLAQGELGEPLARRLRLAQKIRRFASDELGLPDNGSYTRYADIARPFAVWNVFAAPELSLELKRWCFPVAGCVSYRGYFQRDQAERLASELRAGGWDVRLAGVPAYSTLGWFDDPLLSSFTDYPEPELARLIFHELAHQVVYLKDDSTFNESFATAVEEVGLQRWLAMRADPALNHQANLTSTRRQQFVALLHKHRSTLQQAYARDSTPAEKRTAKREAFNALERDYQALKSGPWNGYAGFDRWFAAGVGNAHLASVATYTTLVPAFLAILEQQGGEMGKFYAEVARIAELDKPSLAHWRQTQLAVLRQTASRTAHEQAKPHSGIVGSGDSGSRGVSGQTGSAQR